MDSRAKKRLGFAFGELEKEEEEEEEEGKKSGRGIEGVHLPISHQFSI